MNKIHIADAYKKMIETAKLKHQTCLNKKRYNAGTKVEVISYNDSQVYFTIKIDDNVCNVHRCLLEFI